MNDAECIHCTREFPSFGIVPLCPSCTRKHAACLPPVKPAVTLTITKRDAVPCFLIVRSVMPRHDRHAPAHHIAEIIARRTSTIMYRSKACKTADEARALADKYLAKNADRLVIT
jgi:hypothetical protein